MHPDPWLCTVAPSPSLKRTPRLNRCSRTGSVTASCAPIHIVHTPASRTAPAQQMLLCIQICGCILHTMGTSPLAQRPGSAHARALDPHLATSPACCRRRLCADRFEIHRCRVRNRSSRPATALSRACLAFWLRRLSLMLPSKGWGRASHVQPHVLAFSASRCFRMLPDASGCFRMLPERLRMQSCLQSWLFDVVKSILRC